MKQNERVRAGELYGDGAGNLVEVLEVNEWTVKYEYDSDRKIEECQIGDFRDDFSLCRRG